nr:hypothetical protein [Tanacetum cinerariifolium]
RPVEYFINNDLKYLHGGVLTMTYTTSNSKTKVAQYDLLVTHVSVMKKHRYRYLEEIAIRRADNTLYKFKEGDAVANFAIALRMFTRSLVIQKPDLRKTHPYTPYKNPQGFIYVDDYQRIRLMRSDELYKFSDGTLTKLLSSLEDITKNIDMEYLPTRR